ncbi:MAG: hypothetical protein K0S16_1993 [Moraxellaceae bacterium]|nr:hypothetical protein [Moraxellaceae bacterium]
MKLLRKAAAVVSAIGSPGREEPATTTDSQLRKVAEFGHQVTGVAVARSGRIFVSFPRWTEDTPISVGEVLGSGDVLPFPDAAWNAWRNTRRDELVPAQHFICAQSVVTDHHDNLWVLDPAAPAQAHVVPGGAKLVQIDLVANRVMRTISFNEIVAPLGSYLNDVRFSPDDAWAYITDSGAKGALVVVDLGSGHAHRVLNGHPSTQPEKDVQVKADGHVLRRPDGRGVDFAADGIALSPDGQWLYWQAIKGRTLYRVPAAVLHDPTAMPDTIAGAVEAVGENGPADGLFMDGAGRLYISAIEENAIKVREGDAVRTLVQDRFLRWPDSFAQGPDGALYVTSSRIQDMNWFKPENPAQLRTTLFRIDHPESVGA